MTSDLCRGDVLIGGDVRCAFMHSGKTPNWLIVSDRDDMAKTRALLRICFLIGALSGTTAGAQQHAVSAQSLIGGLPSSITVETTNNRHTVSVCPDTNCTEFRHANADKMDESVVLYLYYFSDHAALKPWRDREQTVHFVTRQLESAELKRCGSHGSVKRDCITDALKKEGLQVFNVRFDESTVHRSRIL
jgi:hypothetical protein